MSKKTKEELNKKEVVKSKDELNFKLPKQFNLIHLSVIIFACFLLGALISMTLMPSPVQEISLKEETLLPSNQEIRTAIEPAVTKLFGLYGHELQVNVLEIEDTENYFFPKAVLLNLTQNGEIVGQQIVFVSRDLSSFTMEFFDVKEIMDFEIPVFTPEEPIPVEVQKTDKPVIELFVMSHCPFGIQMEKGMLPVYETLKDKADFQLKYVNYAMREETEITEQTLQRAIELQYGTEKLWSYLAEFLKDGNTERALNAVNLSKEDLTEKINELDAEFNITAELENKENWLNGRFPIFNLDAIENEKYGVQGSPTLVINGTVIQSGRSPAALLETICNAFIEPPEECFSIELSTQTPSSQFGFEEGTFAEATCG